MPLQNWIICQTSLLFINSETCNILYKLDGRASTEVYIIQSNTSDAGYARLHFFPLNTINDNYANHANHFSLVIHDIS